MHNDRSRPLPVISAHPRHRSFYALLDIGMVLFSGDDSIEVLDHAFSTDLEGIVKDAARHLRHANKHTILDFIGYGNLVL